VSGIGQARHSSASGLFFPMEVRPDVSASLPACPIDGVLTPCRGSYTATAFVRSVVLPNSAHIPGTPAPLEEPVIARQATTLMADRSPKSSSFEAPPDGCA
jgi:hypothetical protein